METKYTQRKIATRAKANLADAIEAISGIPVRDIKGNVAHYNDAIHRNHTIAWLSGYIAAYREVIEEVEGLTVHKGSAQNRKGFRAPRSQG